MRTKIGVLLCTESPVVQRQTSHVSPARSSVSGVPGLMPQSSPRKPQKTQFFAEVGLNQYGEAGVAPQPRQLEAGGQVPSLLAPRLIVVLSSLWLGYAGDELPSGPSQEPQAGARLRTAYAQVQREAVNGGIDRQQGEAARRKIRRGE